MMNPLPLLDLDGDALGASLQALRGSLEVQQKGTADILGILEKVDDRLASLEQNMGPIRRVTEQLTLAEQNVIKSYDAMKKVHKNFKVVGEAEATLRKGLAPPQASQQSRTAAGSTAGLDATQQLQPAVTIIGPEEEAAASSLAGYIEVVDRVQEAMAFLRRNNRMRSAEVTQRQLELKHQKLLADMREEVHRLLASGSSCVVSMVSLPIPASSKAAVAAPLVDFQAADPIPTHLARRVKMLVECLLRSGDGRWADAYLKARRAKIDAAVKLFLDKQAKPTTGGATPSPAAAVGADGTDPRQQQQLQQQSSIMLEESRSTTTSSAGRAAVASSVRVTSVGGGAAADGGGWVRYLQFLRELIKAEEVVYSRSLPSGVSPCANAYLELISPCTAKLCAEAAEALDALVARERGRPGEKALALLALVKGAKREMPFLERMLKDIAPIATRGNAMNASRPVSMAMAGGGAGVAGGVGGGGGAGTLPWEQVTRLYHTLCRLTIAALAALAEDVANDPSGSKNLPPNATVHVVTSNTLRTFKRIMAFEDAFDELAACGVVLSLPWEDGSDNYKKSASGASEEDGEGEEDDDDDDEDKETHLRAYASHLFMSLLRNLRAKADAYARAGDGMDALSQAGRAHLFLMNNAHYMTTTARGSSSSSTTTGGDAKDGGGSDPRGIGNLRGNSLSPRAGAVSMKRASSAIATALSDAFLDRLATVVDESRGRFVQAVWGALAQETKDTDLRLEYVKGSNNTQLTFESGRLIKARFAAFNAALEELYGRQKAFAVPDPGLRQRLREEAKQAVLPGYTAFFDKYGAMQFSKKHMAEYLRFPPATVASMVDELYSG